MLPNIDEISQKLLGILPINAKEIEDELRQQIKLILQASLAKLDVVNREEFDVQSQVLAKTREKIDSLEKVIQELLEKQS
ncbi:MAG: accessory factor UbiK family protein [Gammaproteobacteria bacterium]|nr:accessory factor UbiK family protein [Gammaproteobacteria bacterium]